MIFDTYDRFRLLWGSVVIQLWRQLVYIFSEVDGWEIGS